MTQSLEQQEASRLAHWARISDPASRASGFDIEGEYPALDPIRAAERERANPSLLNHGDGVHDTRTSLNFLWPIDFAALTAEFELDWGMEWSDEPFSTMWFSGDPFIGSCHLEPGPEQIVARETWWRDWTANPRLKVQLHNPWRRGSARMYLSSQQPPSQQ